VWIGIDCSGGHTLQIPLLDGRDGRIRKGQYIFRINNLHSVTSRSFVTPSCTFIINDLAWAK